MIFGIDFGTSNSSISYKDNEGNICPIEINGTTVIPTILFYEEKDDKFLIGEQAKAKSEFNPEYGIEYIKRDILEGESRKLIGNKDFGVDTLATIFIKTLVDEALEVVNSKSDEVTPKEEVELVVTCPSNWGVSERTRLSEIVKLTGYELIEIINEPDAGALYHIRTLKAKDEKKEMKKNIAIYDLGGGTFDVTFVKASINGSKKSIECVYTEGLRDLGGKNWDEVISKDILKKYQEKFPDMNVEEDDELIEEVNRLSRKIKESLTKTNEVNFKIGTKNILEYRLTQEEFDGMTEHLLKQTIDLLENGLDKAKDSLFDTKKKDKLDNVILIGGSTKMSQIKNCLTLKYPDKVFNGKDPKQKRTFKTVIISDQEHAVSKGAVEYGYQKNEIIMTFSKEKGISQKEAKKMLKDMPDEEKKATINRLMPDESINMVSTASHSYGVKAITQDGKKDSEGNCIACLVTFITKGQVIPSSDTLSFSPEKNEQTNASIEIYEYQNIENFVHISEDTILIGRSILELPEGFKENDIINVTLELTESGTIKSYAKAGKKEVSAEFKLEK